MKNKIWFLLRICSFFLIFTLYWFGCSNNPVTSENDIILPLSLGKSISNEDDFSYTVPKTIPDALENEAYQLAPDVDPLTIRFMLLKNNPLRKKFTK